MALTQISTAGVKDDAVTAGKIPANTVGSSELGDNAVDTAAIVADAVTGAKIADDAVGAEHIEQLDADLSFADNVHAKFGAGNDLQIDHSGTNSQIYHDGTGHLYIATQGSGEDLILQAKNSLKISTADSERMRIHSDGNATIGGTDNLARLTVTKTSNNLASAGSFADPHVRLQANPTVDTTGFTGIAYSTSELTNYGFTAGAQRTGTGANPSAFVLRYHNNSATGSELLRVQSGGGISFNGDTAADNSLADYEEGTWTPKILRYDSGWVDASMTDNGTVQLARYVKVGRVCSLYVHWNGWQHSNANYCAMGGLPFSSHSSGGGHGTVSYTDAFTNNQNQGIYIGNSTNIMQFYHSSNAWNGWSTSSARNIHFGLTYITA